MADSSRDIPWIEGVKPVYQYARTAFSKARVVSQIGSLSCTLTYPHQSTTDMSNFTSTAGNAQSASSAKHPLPMTPQVSPYSKAAPSPEAPATPPTQAIKGPISYPSEDAAAATSPPHPPLFASTEMEHHRDINDHLYAQARGLHAGPRLPLSGHEALHCQPQGLVDEGAGASQGSQTGRLVLALIATMPSCLLSPLSLNHPEPGMLIGCQNLNLPHGPSDPATVPLSPPPPMAAAPVRPSGRVSFIPQPSRRSVARNREDKDFNALPDYCPPHNSLPSRSNSLNVDWKGQPIDLSNDPHAHLLHPDEVTLAGNLRLDCVTYLTSKRRIFECRLQCLRTGKDFRKTDAQQACKVDVNKVSKLWTAFNKVGWLDATWVRRFL
jgi:hypothetical protein